MTLGTHTRIREDLRDGIAGGIGLFVPIRFTKGLDIVEWMVV
jgi:hypothetical protein